jgi:hypothetical protein
MNKTDEQLLKTLPGLLELREQAVEFKQRAEKAEEEVTFLREQNTTLIKLLADRVS